MKDPRPRQHPKTRLMQIHCHRQRETDKEQSDVASQTERNEYELPIPFAIPCLTVPTNHRARNRSLFAPLPPQIHPHSPTSPSASRNKIPQKAETTSPTNSQIGGDKLTSRRHHQGPRRRCRRSCHGGDKARASSPVNPCTILPITSRLYTPGRRSARFPTPERCKGRSEGTNRLDRRR
jgi:hypothetical protein